MKLLVATRSDSNIKEMTEITHPIIKSFCKKWNADFMVLDEFKNDAHPYHYRIMNFHKLFNFYDRIASLDSDILILPSCSDIFEEVPYDKIGTVFEDEGSRQNKRREVIRNINKRFGELNWETGYINTGVAIFSRCHSNIFTTIDGQYWNGWGFDDAHLGYQIRKNKFEIHRLHWKFNHMTMFSEEWNGKADRFQSYIIHYGGQGRFDPDIRNRMDQIRRDYKKIYG